VGLVRAPVREGSMEKQERNKKGLERNLLHQYCRIPLQEREEERKMM
jgi:hypothetical protein